jgi:redox-sensing transcriptional repressor
VYHIADYLALDPTLVRKDLALTGIVGKPRIGYPVEDLIESIETFLGWNNTTDAFLIGVGHLGQALLGFGEFEARGLRIVAAFDADPARVGQVVHGREVLPMEKLANLIERMHIHIGIITVPRDAAQGVADILVKAGILAIWNFTITSLHVPEGIVVENADLTPSLAALSSRLRAALETAEERRIPV